MAVVDHSHEFDCFVVGGHTPALVVVVEVKTHDATVVLRIYFVTFNLAIKQKTSVFNKD